MKERFASKAQDYSGSTPKIAMVAKAASELEKSETLTVRASYFPSLSSSRLGTTSPLNKLPRNLSADLKKSRVDSTD